MRKNNLKGKKAIHNILQKIEWKPSTHILNRNLLNHLYDDDLVKKILYPFKDVQRDDNYYLIFDRSNDILFEDDHDWVVYY